MQNRTLGLAGLFICRREISKNVSIKLKSKSSIFEMSRKRTPREESSTCPSQNDSCYRPGVQWRSGALLDFPNKLPILSETHPPRKQGKCSLLRVFLVILSATSGSFSAQGIEPLKELRAPDKTQWTVAIVPKADSRSVNAAKSKENEPPNAKKSLPVALVQSVGAKDGKIYRVLNRYSDQTEEDWWIISQYQHFKYKGQNQITRLLSSQNRAWNLEESDFPELYWVAGLTPELQEIEGKKLLVIKMDASQKPLTKRQQRDLAQLRQAMGQSAEKMPSSTLSPTGTLLLYLDPVTRLPVRFEDLDCIYSYTFDKAPNLREIVPEDIKNEVIAFEQKNSELTRPPSSPKIRNPKYLNP